MIYVVIFFFCSPRFSIKPFSQQPYGSSKPATAVSGDIDTGHPPAQAAWEGRSIATHKFRLLEFSAYMEVQREEMVNIKKLWEMFRLRGIPIIFVIPPFSVSTLVCSHWRQNFVFGSIVRGNKFRTMEWSTFYQYEFFMVFFSLFSGGRHQTNQWQIPRKIWWPERNVRKGSTECILPGEMLGRLEHKYNRRSWCFLCRYQPVSVGQMLRYRCL